MSENESPSWDTKSFQMTDRDRIAMSCLQAWASAMFTSTFDDMDDWLAVQDGAEAAADAAYTMADAMIRRSKLPVQPPELPTLRSVD